MTSQRAERTTTQTLEAHGVHVISAREGRFSLEDVFISVVEKARQAGQGCGQRNDTHPMRRILAQTRKELTQIIRDRMALGLALVLPLTQLILMGSAISLTVADLPIAVQDLDDSPASRTLIDAFRASITFHIVPFCRRPPTRNRVHFEPGARGADHPGPFRARHRARREFARADADRRFRFQHRPADRRVMPARVTSAWNAA